MKKHLRLSSQRRCLPGRWALWLLVWLLTAATAGAQTIRYVRPDGPGTGSSWAQASADLQAMINASGPGDQVWVAGGTYKPGGNANTDRSISFSMKSGVAIYGGFAGTETTLNDRPASVTLGQPSSTTLSGDLGVIGTPDDNSYSVVSNTGVASTAILDGFFITSAYCGFGGTAGGGMRNVNSNPTIRNCFVSRNTGPAGSEGGGMYNDATSDPVLTNCSFDSNYADYAGAISSEGRMTLVGCTFLNNSSFRSGPIIGGTMIMTNCTFNNNSGGGFLGTSGGAARIGSGSTVTNCLFSNNTVAGYGGALAINGDVTITNCTFRGNVANGYGGAGNPEGYGGAIYGGSANTIVTNCSFSGNTNYGRVNSGGGAIGYSNAAFINCSFANNSSDRAGGAIAGGSLKLINCILWGNKSTNTNSLNGIDPTRTSATLTYTDTQDGTPGTGNLNVDPLFVDAPGDNLRLGACSPVIDKGDNSVSVGTTDVVGNPRRVRTIDMGAYEFQGTPLTQVAITSSFNRVYSIPQGGTLTVSVSTTGSVSGYQWYKNGVALTGNPSATSATLTITPLTAADAGDYYVVVTGGCNSVTSNTFRLIVNTGMYTVKTGSWDDPTVWALNRIPISSDPVRLKHLVTIPAGYVAHARRVSYDTGQRLRVGSGGQLKLNH